MRSKVLSDNADIYRFTLEPEDHADCGTGEKHFIGYSRRGYHGSDPAYKETNRGDHHKKKYQIYLDGKCLVVKKVDQPKSRYMVINELVYNDEGKEYYREDINNKYGGSHGEVRRKKGIIHFGRYSIIDMRTGQLMSQYKNYAFFPKSMVHVTAHTIRCEDKGRSISPDSVLRPSKTED